MANFSSLHMLRAGYRKLVLPSAVLLLLDATAGHAQTLQFEQNFENPTSLLPGETSITYTGNPSISTGLSTTNNGSPKNAKYYSEAAGNRAWILNNGGTGTEVASIVFRNIRFAAGSTGNSIEFLLTAISDNPNNGLKLVDNVQVDISTNYGQSYFPVATITGNNDASSGSNGFGNGVVWGYPGNTVASGGQIAIANFNGQNPPAAAAVFTPALNQSIDPKSNTSTLTGAAGYGKVRINVTNSVNTMVRITLSNTFNNQIWGVDEFKVFSNNPVVLPVELTRFDATAKALGVSLDWATASEKNNDRFEVQRSVTGEAFQTIGTVRGTGNSSSMREYSFVDSRPFAGRSYYRLRQVDTDGTSSFSPVVAVQTRTEVGVYPNPSTSTVTLPAALGRVRYRILNTLGQTLLSGQAAGNDRLDLTTLAKGTFFLELTGETGCTTQRLVHE